MGIDRASAGTDKPAEAAEEPPPPDRRPPPDRPGAEGAPSRADSRNGAAAANDTSTQNTESQTEEKPDTSQASQETSGEQASKATEKPEVRGTPESNEGASNDGADERYDTGPSQEDTGGRSDTAQPSDGVIDPTDAERREQPPDGQGVPHDGTTPSKTDKQPESAIAPERTEDKDTGNTSADDSANTAAPSAVDIGDRPDSAPKQTEDTLVSVPDTQELPRSFDAPADVGDTRREHPRPAADSAEAVARTPEVEGQSESADKPQVDPRDQTLPAADTSTGAEQGGEIETTEPASPTPDNATPAADTTEQPPPVGEHGPDVSGESRRSIDRQRALGNELAEIAEQKVNREIDQTLDKVNPQFDRTKSAYSENCTGVVQANELRRRGFEVEAGPLEKRLRTDEGGPGGRLLEVIQRPWGRSFTPGTKAEIEEAFKQPGSRGVVYIAWSGPGGGGHVFNVENVGGKVRFVDGQPTPPVSDASHYFNVGHDTRYVRLDDRATPPESATNPYLEP